MPFVKVNAPASTALCTDPAELPFKNGSFDAVLAMAVLHHMNTNDLARTLEESHRVLMPDGCFLLLEDWAFTDPTRSELEAKRIRFMQGNDEFHLTWPDWDSRFAESGFRLVERCWPKRRFMEVAGRKPSRGLLMVRMMAALYDRMP